MTDHDNGERFVGHFTYERSDYAALIDAMRRERWGLRTILTTMLVSAVVLIVGLTSKNWTQFVATMHDLATLNSVPLVYVVIFGALLVIALLPQILKWRALQAYSSVVAAHKQVELSLDEAGFSSATKGRQGRVDWSEVPQVFVLPDHLILVISRREAVCVPKRAFANAMEFTAAAALARRKVPLARPW